MSAETATTAIPPPVLELPAPALVAPAARVARLAQRLLDQPLADLRRATAHALGLAADDAPVVATGHQAQIRHAGIVAKWFATDALAGSLRGRAVQLVVDEDINDPGLVEYPALRGEGLVVATLPMESRPQKGPVALREPVRPRAPEHPPVAEVAEGLARIVDALRATGDRANAALQLAAANDLLLADIIEPMPTVTGTALMGAPIGVAILEAMRRDPQRCIDAYNDALAADPHVAAPLAAATAELPLWILTKGEERTRFHLALHGEHVESAVLAPRAFLLTALARLGLCDCFVHGTGGRRYESVSEAWIKAWLGIELAPIAVATTTLRLPLDRYPGSGPFITKADLRRAQWDPAAPDGATLPSAAKQALLDRIARLPRRSVARREAYRALLDHLEGERLRDRDRLESLERALERTRDGARAAELAQRRTWPFPLHPPEALRDLRDALRVRVALGAR